MLSSSQNAELFDSQISQDFLHEELRIFKRCNFTNTRSNNILRKIYVEVGKEQKEVLETSTVPLNISKMSSCTCFIPNTFHSLESMEISKFNFSLTEEIQRNLSKFNLALNNSLTRSFPCENHCKCYKKLASRLWSMLYTLTIFFLYILSSSTGKQKVFVIIYFLSKLDHIPLINDIYYNNILT